MYLNDLGILYNQIILPRKKKFNQPVRSDSAGIRFATPEIVAQYRARRLKCRKLADISCGIGGQTIFFAKECEMVYAIEIDPKKIEYAKENCRQYGVDNVEFICADALSKDAIDQIPEVDIIFSDPARPATEDKRNIMNLEPAIPNVIAAYSHKTHDFAFEAPPQLTPEKIPFDCEREYLSLDGKLNRLTLYFGNLKRSDRSAVALPTGARINSDEKKIRLPEVNEPGSYAYEPEPSVIKADLLDQLIEEMQKQGTDVKWMDIDKKRILLTSDIHTQHPMIKNHYIVMHTTDMDTKNINTFLKKYDVESVILRAGVEPANYWPIRNEIENGLTGTRKVHIFVKDNKAIICEPV